MSNANVAKVIVTTFANRKKEVRTWPSHSQEGLDAEGILEMLKVIYQLEQSVDNGICVDTIIVNNDIGYTPGNKYLASINGTKTKNGEMVILTRENVGRAFGGYNYAFKQLREQYEYWIFLEDDQLLIEQHCIMGCIGQLNSEQLIAYVAVHGELGHRGRSTEHVHGGAGCTSREYIDEIVAVHGCIPHYKGPEEETNVDHHVWAGEVPFTNTLVKLGLKLEPYYKNVVTFYSDYQKALWTK